MERQADIAGRPRAPQGGNEGSVQVVARAAQILRALSESPRPLTLSALSGRLDLPRSTVHRLVTALEAEGLVGRVGEREGYRLGLGLMPLGQAARRWVGQELRPKLQELSRQLNETVDLAVLEGDRVVFVEQVIAPNRLQVVSGIGMGFPLHCTANGKAFLADLTDEQVAALLPERLTTYTPSTIPSRTDLLGELADIRASGVAYDREEYTPGICAVGVVVRDAVRGALALSVPVPAQRFYGQEERIAGVLRGGMAKLFAPGAGEGPASVPASDRPTRRRRAAPV